MSDGLVMIMFFGIVVGCLAGVAYFFGELDCRAKMKDSGHEWRYEFVGGCQVKDGGWVPLANWRVM